MVTQKIPSGNIILLNTIKHREMPVGSNLFMNTNTTSDFGNLLKFQKMYQNKEEGFNLKDFENTWKQVLSEMDLAKADTKNTENWFTVNSTLLELTGNGKYAGEMEHIIYTGIPSEKINNLVTPFIFTRYDDIINVNLFVPSEMNYIHTLQGLIKIRMETDYPESDTIKIKFNTIKKRYVELLVRIPEWAKGAAVTVKGVKYLPVPGKYCQVAREWENGDEVEIFLPTEEAPVYLKQYSKF